MFLRIKTIKEFEEACLKEVCDDYEYYIIDKDDLYKFPLGNKFWKDLIGRKIEVQKEGFYTRQGINYQLYKMKDGFFAPYWFFSKHEHRSLKIE